MEDIKRIDISEIADRCGISVSTVRSVLNGSADKRRVSEGTIAEVRRIAAAGNWQPRPAREAVAETAHVCPPMERELSEIEPADYDFDGKLSESLRQALGDEGFLRLVERYGGIRLYVPNSVRASGLADEITAQHAATLIAAFAGTYIRVPLARQFRHSVYRGWGYSNAKIARLLGVTESAIDKMNRGLSG